MMRKALLFASLSMALTACTQSRLETGVAPSAAFAPMVLPAQVFDSPQSVIAFFVGRLGRNGASRQEIGDYPGASGDQLLLFTAEGLEDDSVSDQQWRVLLDQTDSGFIVVSAGIRYKCARSASNAWTTALCP